MKFKSKFLKCLNSNELDIYNSSSLYIQYVSQSFNYSETIIDFNKEHLGEKYINNSIIIYNVIDEPVMVMYAWSDSNILTYFNNPVNVFHLDSLEDKRGCYEVLISKINELTKEQSIGAFLFYDNDYLIGNYYSKISSPIVEYDAYIDLSYTNDIIKSNLRKSYKSLVNWGERNLQIELIDSSCDCKTSFNQFKDFHVQVSGKITRSDKCWDIFEESLKNNSSFLVFAKFENQLVAASLIQYGNKIAYYSMGVYDRELMAKNVAVAHFNILYSVYYAKQIGLKEFDLGFCLNDNTEIKESNIFKFKSGFTNTIRLKNRILINL